jgi:hypothetical protein
MSALDACLSEESVAELRKCTGTDVDRADIWETTGRMLSRRTEDDATSPGPCWKCARRRAAAVKRRART